MLLATTSRLFIRHLTEEDGEALVSILCDNEVMRYSIRGPMSKEEIDTWLKGVIAEYDHPGFSVWAIILKDENKLIGFSGIRPVVIDGHMEIEIMFRLAQAYWNQGYAFEAAQACIEYAFNQLAINSIIAIVDPRNERSINVIDKLKMAYEKDSIYKNFPIRVYRLNKF